MMHMLLGPGQKQKNAAADNQAQDLQNTHSLHCHLANPMNEKQQNQLHNVQPSGCAVGLLAEQQHLGSPVMPKTPTGEAGGTVLESPSAFFKQAVGSVRFGTTKCVMCGVKTAPLPWRRVPTNRAAGDGAAGGANQSSKQPGDGGTGVMPLDAAAFGYGNGNGAVSGGADKADAAGACVGGGAAAETARYWCNQCNLKVKRQLAEAEQRHASNNAATPSTGTSSLQVKQAAAASPIPPGLRSRLAAGSNSSHGSSTGNNSNTYNLRPLRKRGRSDSTNTTTSTAAAVAESDSPAGLSGPSTPQPDKQPGKQQLGSTQQAQIIQQQKQQEQQQQADPATPNNKKQCGRRFPIGQQKQVDQKAEGQQGASKEAAGGGGAGGAAAASPLPSGVVPSPTRYPDAWIDCMYHGSGRGAAGSAEKAAAGRESMMSAFAAYSTEPALPGDTWQRHSVPGWPAPPW